MLWDIRKVFEDNDNRTSVQEDIQENAPFPDLTEDPRPDLAEDSEAWRRFLKLALANDETLAEILHGFRCAGARLVRRKSGFGFVLRPDPGYNPDPEAYRMDAKRWLRPMGKQVEALLSSLR